MISLKLDFEKPNIGFWAKRIIAESRLYLTNHVINRVPSHQFRLFCYRHLLNFEIGQNSFIFMDTWFDAGNRFVMADHSVINQKCRLDTRGGITIGKNVSISAEVCILTADHDLQCENFTGRNRPVVIEDYVFVGTRAMILPGVTLKKGCAVAAGAVVTRDVEPFTIVAGSPAKPIGSRSSTLNYTIHYDRLFA